MDEVTEKTKVWSRPIIPEPVIITVPYNNIIEEFEKASKNFPRQIDSYCRVVRLLSNGKVCNLVSYSISYRQKTIEELNLERNTKRYKEKTHGSEVKPDTNTDQHTPPGSETVLHDVRG